MGARVSVDDGHLADGSLTPTLQVEDLTVDFPTRRGVEFRAKLDGAGISDDELLLRYFAGREDVEKMKAAAPLRDHLSVRLPLFLLIEELIKKKTFRQVVVQRGALAVRLERRGAAGNS